MKLPVVPSLPASPVGDRNPFEVFLLASGMLQGFSVLTGLANPSSITATLPPFMQVVWAILLGVGGLLALSGLSWFGDPFTGIEIKRVGLICSGFGALIYGIAMFSLGSKGISAGLATTAFAAACFWRTVQLAVRLRKFRTALSSVRILAAGDEDGG